MLSYMQIGNSQEELLGKAVKVMQEVVADFEALSVQDAEMEEEK